MSTVTPSVRRARAQPPDSLVLCGLLLLGIELIMVHDTLASSVTNYFRLHFSSPYVGLKLLG